VLENISVCFVIWFSATNGGIAVVAGIDDEFKESGSVALHLSAYHADENLSNWFGETLKIEWHKTACLRI
jgi:hypothetical protein